MLYLVIIFVTIVTSNKKS